MTLLPPLACPLPADWTPPHPGTAPTRAPPPGACRTVDACTLLGDGVMVIFGGEYW